jgi:hypothetical protein
MSTEHSCAFCRIAARENVAQIERFTRSKKSAEDFLNDPIEDQISSDLTELMIQHDKVKRIETYYTTP